MSICCANKSEEKNPHGVDWDAGDFVRCRDVHIFETRNSTCDRGRRVDFVYQCNANTSHL